MRGRTTATLALLPNTTATVSFEVQEYLPVLDKWVTAYGSIETVDEARDRRKRYEETFRSDAKFRVAQIVTAVEVTVLD